MSKQLTKEDIEKYFEEKGISIGEFFYKDLANPAFIEENIEFIFEIFKDNQSEYFRSVIEKVDEKTNCLQQIIEFMDRNKKFINKDNAHTMDYYLYNYSFLKKKQWRDFLQSNALHPELTALVVKYQIKIKNTSILSHNIKTFLSKETLFNLYVFSLKEKESYEKFMSEQKQSIPVLGIAFFIFCFTALLSDLSKIDTVFFLSTLVVSFFLSVPLIFSKKSKKEKQRDIYYEYECSYSYFLQQILKDMCANEKFLTNPENLRWDNLKFEYKKDVDNKQEFQSQINDLLKSVENKNKSQNNDLIVKKAYDVSNNKINEVLSKINNVILENQKYSQLCETVKMFETYYQKINQFSAEVLKNQESEVEQTLEHIYDCLKNEIEFLKEKENINLKITNKFFSANNVVGI